MKNVDDVYRLSPMQHGLLFHTLYALDAGMYLEQFCYRLGGPLDVDTLERAWHVLLERHPVLRTAFVWQGLAEPLQVVRGDARLPFVVFDWRHLDESKQEAELEAFLAADRERGFVLEEAPLMRAAVLRLSTDDAQFVWTFHHALLDGWSCPIVLNEAFAIYDALRCSRTPAPAPARPYRDYIAWLNHQDVEAAEVHWRRALAGFDAPVVLPIDGADGSAGAGREVFRDLRVDLSPEATSALQAMTRRHRLTQSTVVQGAWALLLSRYTGRDDVVFGTTVSGRNAELAGIESMVGLFVNTLPTRVRMSPSEPLLPWLERLMRDQVESQPYASTSLVDIQRWSDVPRGTPLFGSIVGFENYPQDLAHLELPGDLAVRDFRAVERVHYPLTLLVVPGPRLALLFYYDQSRFAAGDMARLADHLRTLIEAMVADPGRRLGELPMVTAGERAQLLGEWNQTTTDYPRDETIARLFERQVSETPDAVALSFEAGDVTYRALNARANRLAHALRAGGVGEETVVGLFMERSADLVVAMLGVLKAGGAYLPLDSRAPADRLAGMLEDAGASLVLTLRQHREQVPPVERVVYLDDESLAGTRVDNPRPSGRPESLAYVMYTSGSTGRPKGVAVSQRGVVRLVKNTNFARLDAGEVLLGFAPPSFDASTLELWGALLNGGRLAIFPPLVPSLDELGRFIATQDVTTLWLTAGLFHRVADDQAARLASVRQLLAGGDVLSPAHARSIVERVPGLTLINGYGPTENTTFTCCHRVASPSDVGRTVPIGRPVANTRVYLLDAGLGPVPVGVPGELWAAGDGLARGYLRRPDLTGDAFRPDPHAAGPGERMYRTGDRARFLPDSACEFLGRVDRQAKVRGFRVEPAEIEARLVTHPAVREAVVVVADRDAEDKTLIAYVVPDPDHEPGESEGALASQHVTGWQSLFDQHIYGAPAAIADPLFNTTGWISRVDGTPISVEDMRAWADDIVGMVRRRAPRRVLEIGCGTGMLLFQIAPSCEAYHGTDFSEVALAYVETQRRRHRPELSQLTLERRLADDFTDMADDSYDAVILSSIVQYFPDVDYLLRVLEGCLRVVKAGGTIFLCDLRNLALLEAFHTAAELSQAPDELEVRALKQAVQRAITDENELLVAPALFAQLKRRFAKIAAVSVRLQRGPVSNELSQFRYHAILELGPARSDPPLTTLDGRRHTLADVRRKLGEGREAVPEGRADAPEKRADAPEKRDGAVAVTRLVNGRVARAVACAELLASPSCPSTVGELRRALAHVPAPDDADAAPEALWALGAELDRETVVCWSSAEAGAIDGVFARRGSSISGVDTPPGADAPLGVDTPLGAGLGPDRPWSAFANRPLRTASRSRLAPELRRHLEAVLPDYMIPGVFVTLDRLPLTRIGKVDRDALPAPETRPAPPEGARIAGRSPLEDVLAEAFADVLGVRSVGIEESFFDLGGHSLLATSLVSRVRDVLQVEIPLRKVFELPTVSALCAWLDEQRSDGSMRPLPPVVPVASDRPLPLSFAQQRLWFLERMGTTGSAYHSPINLRLRGTLDERALARSLDTLVRRHEALRTGFREIDGEPRQIVAPPRELEIAVEDLRGLDPAAREGEARRLVEEENARPFDLAHGPLLRVKLLKLAPAEHWLLLTFHHLALDGWSVGVLVREIGECYRAYAAGRAPRLPELPVQYPAFAVWQRSRPFAESIEVQLEYWTRALADLEPLQLPTDRPRPAVQTVRGAVHDFAVPEDVTRALERLGRDEGVTLFMTLLAAFTALLHRYTGQAQIAVGTAIANRNRGETEGLIGFFVNTLVLATRVDGRLPFRALLDRVRDTALAAYAHQDLPFERLVDELAPERDLSRNPLVQVAFMLQRPEHMAPRLRLPGLDAEMLPRSGITVRVDLELDMWPEGRADAPGQSGLRGMCVYNTDLFTAATIERMAAHFRTLLAGIVACGVDTPVARLPLLGAEELRELRVADQEGGASAPPDAFVHEVFERWAAETPDAPAILFEESVLTYAEVNARANQLAHSLRAMGVGPEVLVGIGLDRSPDMIVAVLATLKAGGAFLPLDPTYPEERLAFMMADAAASILISRSEILDRLPPGDAILVCLDESAPVLRAISRANPGPRPAPDNLAYVIYTSGSTGRPKGALLTHRGLAHLQRAQGRVLELNRDDRVLQFAAFSFDAAVADIVQAYACGAALVLARQDTLRSAPDLLDGLNRHAVTVATLPPSLLGVLSPEAPALATLLSAGEACAAPIVEAWAPGRRFFNAYGPSETTVCATMARCQAGEGDPPPIGRPIDHARVYLLDQYLEPVPAGVAGEIYIGGEGVGRGYRGRADLSAERFVADPFASVPGARMYRPGDRGRRRADGQLEFLGRVDRQLKIRGYRIEPGEIESLLKGHAEVQDAVVVEAPAQSAPPPAAIDGIELWPSVAEYFVYDDTLYYALTSDASRHALYRVALERHVPGRTVVDIGTGADAILARMCVEAGARHVYAVEMLEDAAQKARARVQALGLADRITVLLGDATTIELPERVDVCVSEIVGSIGGAEGAAYLVNDARRFLRPGGRMIPELAVTRIAAVSLPTAVVERPAFTPLTAGYLEKIFRQVGRRFDVRVCLKGAGRSHLISNAETFESLDFREPLALESTHHVSLVVDRAARLDGFLVWLTLYPVEDRGLDTLDGTSAWIPVFLPAFGAGMSVAAGTRIETTIVRSLCDNGRNPDFRLEGRVELADGSRRPFTYVSRHAATDYRGTPFYRRLFGAADADAAGGKLVAYVVPRTAPGLGAEPLRQELSAQQIADWRVVFDGVAGQGANGDDPLFNSAGWNESYTGAPFPREAMRSWARDAVAQVLAAEPRRVLEIGCGSGMLLFQIARKCEAYHGTDLSPASLDSVRRQLERHPEAFSHVTLERRLADDFSGMPDASYDAVVLNSVVQYFPDLGYLLDVLAGCLRVVRPGGVIFLGDLRNLCLADAFYASVVLAAAPDEAGLAGLAEGIRRRTLEEDELFVDPGLFPALAERDPRITATHLRLPDGSHPNELNKFRYQVLLSVGGPPSEAQDVACEPGTDVTMEDLEARLAEGRVTRWRVRAIPHLQVRPDVVAAERILHDRGMTRVEQLRDRLLREPAGLDPQAILDLAARHGYEAEAFWSNGGGDGRFDVLVVRRDVLTGAHPRPTLAATARPGLAWGSYANTPLRARRIPEIVAALRELMAARLPAYMRPSAFVVLDQMPLTPEGKIDRRALPAAETERSGAAADAGDAVSPLEDVVTAAFAELLGRERVGPHDHFFELGGHSLLATTLVSRLRDALDVELPLQHVFELATPAALARWIEARPLGDALAAPPIQRVRRDASIPLSFAQQRLWFLDQMGVVGHAYHVPLHLRLLGTLDREALERTLGELLRRHESLRTRFRAVGEEPVQVIVPAGEIALPLVDLAPLPAEARETALRRLIGAENERRFDLSEGPLLRATLVRNAIDDHVLLLTVHHIVSDGWSLGVVVRELSALYAAFLAGAPSPLPEPSVQYADFAVWQRRCLAGATLERQLRYWTARLADLPQLRLPTDRQRPPVETFRGAFTYFRVSEETTSGLRALGRARHATLFMTLLAGFQTLLGRLSGQSRVVVGSPIANRTRGETEGLIGFFVNSLVLDADLGGRPSFTEALDRVRRTTLDAYAHQDLPFERLVEELAPERSLSRNPLFQVMFVLQPRESIVPSFRMPDLTVSLVAPEQITVRFDLEVYVWPEGRGLKGAWLYNADLFDGDTIERMTSHYRTLLDAVALDADGPIARLPLLSGPEALDLIRSGNDTRTAYPRATIQALFEAQAARRPDAVAIVFDTGGSVTRLTYRELNERANALAHRLRRLGVVDGTLVALSMERSPALVIGVLGILKAGGAYLPIDPTHPTRHQDTMLADARPAVVLTAADLDDPALGGERLTNPPPRGGPESRAYVNYTSGSTGVPKGIVIPHRAVLRLVFGTNYVALTDADRVLHASNVSFDAATFELWGALLHGGTLVIVPRETVLAPNAYAAALRDHDVSALFITTALFNRVVDERPEAFAPVANVLVGGEAFDAEHGRAVLRHPPKRFVHVYGPTESTTFASWYEVREIAEDATTLPIGGPLSNTRLYVLDDEGTPQPLGAPGELHIGGDGLAHGYLDRPALTAEKFVPDPHAETAGARMYRTGDQARLRADRAVEFLGRVDAQVKLRGFRVELGDIEAHLLTHPAVRETAVAVRQGPDGDRRLAAYVVVDPAHRLVDGADPGALASGQVTDWERVFDEHVYRDDAPVEDPLFNTTGWRSSHDGAPIPLAEMLAWAEDVVGHVLAEPPRRVLELGCGTGMLLFRIAPRCEAYLGVDVSRVSLDYVARQMAAHAPRYAHVRLERRAADDLAGLAAGSFDVVLLSSTVQYFPDVDYLLRTIEASLRVLSPGGRVVLADVRSLPLLEAFHTSVELARAAGDLPTPKLRARVRHAVFQENELAVDPAFFAALPARFPEIAEVRVEVQRGRVANELNRFRYSVVLRRGGRAKSSRPVSWLDTAAVSWHDARALSLADVNEVLERGRPDVVGFRGAPNARLTAIVAATTLIAREDAPATAQAIRRVVSGAGGGIEPDDLRALGDRLGYETRVGWSADGAPGTLDVVFARGDAARSETVDAPPAAAPRPVAWEGLANSPLRARLAPEVVRELRRYLGDRVPDYMVPADFVLLDALPLGATGKVDRRALPEPDAGGERGAGTFEAGRTPSEQTLARLFADLLGVERVSVHDNFFDLGGHSLLATRLASRVRDTLGIELPLRDIFESPTVAGMAAAVARTRMAGATPDEMLRLIEELEALPEEEARRLLGDETKGLA